MDNLIIMRRKKILYDGIPLSVVIASISLAFGGMKRSEIAERIGLHYSTFSHYYEGHTEMPTDIVIKIRKLTGRSIIEDALRMYQSYKQEDAKRIELQPDYQHHPVQAQTSKRRKKSA